MLLRMAPRRDGTTGNSIHRRDRQVKQSEIGGGNITVLEEKGFRKVNADLLVVPSAKIGPGRRNIFLLVNNFPPRRSSRLHYLFSTNEPKRCIILV